MYVNVFFDNNLLLVLHVLNIVSLSSSTLQEIYHRGGKPERAMHCCHGTQAMDNNRICHHLLFNECGKQYFVQSFNGLRSMKLLRLSLNFTLELWSEFLTLMINYAWFTWSELNYSASFVLSSVSTLLLSVMVRSCHACVIFAPRVHADATAGWAYRIHEGSSWNI